MLVGPFSGLYLRVILSEVRVGKGRIFSASWTRKFEMKIGRFRESQILGILNEADSGVPVLFCG